MKNNPFVSIITVVYNGDKHLEQTIQSVFNQSYKDIEYIIIDGASTDGTLGIIRKYEKHIDYWVSEPDLGIYDAMNKGINRARGDYVGLINSDDYYEIDAIETIVKYSRLYPDVDIFFGNMYMLNEFLDNKKLFTNKKGQKLDKKFSIWHPTAFIKKKIYDEYGVFDLSYKIAADYELLLRLYKEKCKFHYINEAISNFREGGISYYNKNIIKEQFDLQLIHTTFANAVIVMIKSKATIYIQNVFKIILGERKYHKLRYKYLY